MPVTAQSQEQDSPLKKSALLHFLGSTVDTQRGTDADMRARIWQSANCFPDSQESLELQRGWNIHQAEAVQNKINVKCPPLCIGNMKNDPSNTPQAPQFHQLLYAQKSLYLVTREDRKQRPVEDCLFVGWLLA